MKTTRKILSILLVLAMVSALFVVGATAEGESAVEAVKLERLDKNAPIGKPADATNVKYLSDLHNQADAKALNDFVVGQVNSKIVLNSAYSAGAMYFIEGVRKDSTSSVDADGNRTFTLSDGSTLTLQKNNINLGYTAVAYEKGLGVHPDTKTKPDRHIVYNVSSLGVDRFYAVVGAQAGTITQESDLVGVTFELWGSTATSYDAATTEFVKLAYVDDIRGWQTAEFDVDITGYNYIKLVIKLSPQATTNSGSGVAWGDACVYKAPAQPETTHNYTVEYNVSVNGAAYTPITAPEGAFTGEAGVPYGTVVGQTYLINKGLPATVTSGDTTYALEDVQRVAVTANDTVIKVYYSYWINYTSTANFAITETVNTGCGAEGAVDLADWQYVEPGSFVTAGSNGRRYVGVNAQYDVVDYAAEGGTPTPATKALNDVNFTKFYMFHASKLTDEIEANAVIDVTGLGNRFYAVVGNENSKAKSSDFIGTVFRIYGSTAADGEWTLLACSGEMYGKATGEFNVDITGYNFLKLEVDTNREALYYSSRSVLWGNPAVYTVYDYTVNYDGNGGKTEDDKTTVADEENVTNAPVVTKTIAADNNSFVREGYIFKGWNTKADGTGTAYVAGAEIALSAEANEVTLYAQWEEKAADVTYYTVTYVADGVTVSTQTIEAGKDATAPAVPAKDGYTGAWDGDGKAISADTTITAVYTIKTYTVTFKVEGQDDTTATVEHGADATLPTIPEKTGYTGSWDHDGKNITADTTITATYKRQITTQKVSLKDDPSGAPRGSNKTYLSDLHDKSEDGKNLGLNKYVIDQGNNSKIVLNESYSQPAYYFIDGGRKVGDGKTGYDAETGYRTFTRADGTTIKIHKNQVVLGKTGTLYEKALGVHPNTKGKADRYIVYDISSLDVNAFYAVVGATGNRLTVIDTKSADYDEGRGVTFEVWGSMDETYNKETTEFVKLAYVDEISGYNIGEFKVNLEGINFLKLVVKVSPDATTNDSSAVAWGGAMVYKAENSAGTSDSFSMTAVAAAIVAATSVVALVVARKKFF